jgi:hypothetical protein
LFINFTSLLCSYNQGSFHHTQSQHSHPPTSKVKNAWYYTSTPPYAYSLLLIDFILPAAYQVATKHSNAVEKS